MMKISLTLIQLLALWGNVVPQGMMNVLFAGNPPWGNKAQAANIDCPHGYAKQTGDIPNFGASEAGGRLFNISSVSQCAVACNGNNKCLSFEFSKADQGCNLNNKRDVESDEQYKDYIFCSRIANYKEGDRFAFTECKSYGASQMYHVQSADGKSWDQSFSTATSEKFNCYTYERESDTRKECFKDKSSCLTHSKQMLAYLTQEKQPNQKPPKVSNGNGMGSPIPASFWRNKRSLRSKLLESLTMLEEDN